MPASEKDLWARFAALGITVETHRHAPVFTVAQAKALRGELPAAHTKNLFLKDKKGALWLVIAPGDRLEGAPAPHRLGGALLCQCERASRGAGWTELPSVPRRNKAIRP